MNRTCCLILILATSWANAAERARSAIGDIIPDLHFKDIRTLSRSLHDLGEHPATVLVFTNTACPLVQKYWPKLKRLDDEYRDRGVQLVSVNVGPNDDITDVAQQAIDFGVLFPVVKDTDGSCVQALGVERTPEVVVLDAQRRLRYRGRIDDQYRIGGARPDVTRDDLQQAIDDVLAQRTVVIAETPVDGCLITRPTFTPPSTPVTFYEHVLPLLQAHCQECHRTNGTAPFALINYDEVVAHAETIAEVVADRRMPPWHASRRQHFVNERGLSGDERNQLIAWDKMEHAAGDASKAPPQRVFNDSKWEIGEPDLVTTALETHTLPAEGFVDYKYVVLPHLFLQDTWVAGVEIKPSNPRVVHHCNLGFASIGKKFDDGNFITGRVPGGTAMILDEGVGFRIAKNSVLILQIHYTTTGKEEENRMSVGLCFPRKVQQELHHLQGTTSKIAIPPRASAHPVTATRTLPADASGIGMFAHMHLRGKDMTFTARYPSGESETLLSIPNYDFNWQQNYRWAPGTKKFPKGTQIDVTAHYDNSPFNPFNPDPTATVKHGQQTIHEMMFGFFFYTVDGEDLNLRINPKNGQAE